MLGEELAVDVGDLAHEQPAACSSGQRQLDRAPAREAARPRPRRGRARAGRRARARRRRPRAPRATRARAARSPATSASSIASQLGDVARHRARRGRSSARAGSSRRAGRARSVGLKPTTPQQAAGIRIEPPESVPSAASASPAASAAAEPPLEPPATRPGARGFGTVAEVRVLRRDAVGELVQVRLADDRVAGRLEPPHRRAPSRAGTWSAKIADPYVVARPAVSNRSLTASRIPVPTRRPGEEDPRHLSDLGRTLAAPR